MGPHHAAWRRHDRRKHRLTTGAVWDEPLSGHLASGSAGAALSAAGIAADPWSTPLPGTYGAGTAGYLIGNYVTAVPPTTAQIAAAILKTPANLLATDANGHVTYANAAPPTAAAVSTQVAADLASAHGAGSWATATGFATPADVSGVTSHGDAHWATATGFPSAADWTAELAGKLDSLSFAGGNVRATLDGETVLMDAAGRNAIADAILQRDVSNVEDSAPEHSLALVVLAMSESNTMDHAGWLTVYKTDGVSKFVRKELLTADDVQSVTGIR